MSFEKSDTHILVADDEPGMRDMLALELEGQGYQVSCASNGVEALERFQGEKIDLVITDLKMPEMDGLELLKNIKLLNPGLEVIMSTGHGTIEDAVTALKEGAYDFILKPFNLDELNGVVEKVLEKRKLKKLVTLYELSSAVFSTIELEKLLQIIMDVLPQVFDADECSIMLLDEQNKLTLRASRSLTAEAVEAQLKIGESVLGLAERRARLLNEGFERSSMVCPLFSQGQLLGVMSMRRKKGKPDFTNSDLQSASILAAQTALAIQNASLYRKLQQAHERLEETQSELIQAEKLASIGTLAAGIAHEINNPVGYIGGNLFVLSKYAVSLIKILGKAKELQAAASKNEGGNAHQIAEEMSLLEKETGLEYILHDLQSLLTESREGVERIRKIVSDLRAYSHSVGCIKLEDLNKVIDSAINIAWNEIKYKAELEKDYAVLPLVQCDGQQIGQVIINLLINAVHAIPEKGMISVRTSQQGNWACVEIKDNGTGIPPEIRSKIFDPFFTTKEVGKGTGLGLSVSREILQKHGGRIEVQSEAGKGSVFTLFLPCGGVK